MADIRIVRIGDLLAFAALTERGEGYLEANVGLSWIPADASYLDDITKGIENDGLTLEVEAE
jgi:hypothetical protein